MNIRPIIWIRVNVIVYPFFMCMHLFAKSSISHPHSRLLEPYRALLNFQLNEAREMISDFQPSSPEDISFTVVLQSLSDIIELTMSDNHTLFDELSNHENAYISRIKSIDNDSDWQTFAEAEIRLHWSYTRFRMGDELGAAIRLFRSWEIIENGIQSNPDFVPYYRTYGVMNILLGALPDKYDWIMKLLGVEASISEGIDYLEKCVDQPESIYSSEAYYILKIMKAFILPGAVNLTHEKLPKNEIDNYLIIKYLNMLISIKSRNVDLASKYLNEFLVTDLPIRYPVIYYWMGECYMRKGDYVNAAIFYKSYIQKYEGINLVKDAYYKLSILYFLNDETDLAEKYRDLASEIKGKSIMAPDHYAEKQIKSHNWPDKELYKARMAFDGGYYEKAIRYLENHRVSSSDSPDVELEYHYRMARIFHAQEKYQEAIEEYKETVRLSDDIPGYFAPNSTLNLGYIYEIRGNRVKAREYFNKVLDYKRYEYKINLDTQAKVALQLLDN